MSMVVEWEWKIYKIFVLDSCTTNKLLKRCGNRNRNSRKEMNSISVHLTAVFSGTINLLEINYFKYASSLILEIDIYD